MWGLGAVTDMEATGLCSFPGQAVACVGCCVYTSPVAAKKIQRRAAQRAQLWRLNQGVQGFLQDETQSWIFRRTCGRVPYWGPEAAEDSLVASSKF